MQGRNTPVRTIAKFKMQQANWELFTRLLVPPSQVNLQTLTSSILNAAEASIPRSKPGNIRKMVPWWSPFNLEDLDEAIRNTKSCSPGGDGIHNQMLRHCSAEMKEIILKFFNTCWIESTYPSEWKQAVVVPIPKRGKDPLLAQHYRPISLTSCLGKLLEKMVNGRLQTFLERNNIYVPYQTGFRKGRSTIDHLVKLSDRILNTFDSGEHLVGVFFDIKGAYDMTWRYGILQNMFKYNLRGNLPKFIQSFVENRKFVVRVGDAYSNEHVLENGVPQGSTLSCSLFGIAINEIARGVADEIGKCLYVDDLTIFCADKTIGIITRKLQVAINQICNNANAVGFVLSEEKTKVAHFCRLRKPHYDPVLFMNDRIISVVQEVKFLGLTFDRELRWSAHIQNVATTCRKSLNVIRVLAHHKWGAHPKTLLDLYKGLILSRIDYGCSVYSTCSSTTLLGKLDRIQNLAIRYCLGAFPTSPVESLHVEANILPLALRRKQIVVNYYLKVSMDGKHPNYHLLRDVTTRARLYRCRSLGERAREEFAYLQLEYADIVDMTMTARRGVVKARVYERWNGQWAESDAFLKRVKAEIGPLFPLGMARLALTRLFRLRLGHSALTHGFLLAGDDRPQCDHCGVDLSLEHILCVCPEYRNARDFNKISDTWAENLNTNDKCLNTLRFISSIGFNDKL
uniref:Reverse transcriptase domain-containing protein n=1 Tax=Photinus pyralis TaxID=7054 RepID=A0A1Y1K801_PHOPY